MSNEDFLTGLTGWQLRAPRARSELTPVRPVRRGKKLTGPDGSDGSARDARTHIRRKAASPSDPSGAGTIADIVYESGSNLHHLAATRRIRIGYIACDPGEPLCGTPAALHPCPPALFPLPPDITCWLCAALAKREHILIAGEAA